MPISIEQSDSTRKSINVTITPSATGVSVAGSVRWFDDEFTIAPTSIACTYVEDQTYRVVLCRSATGPVLVLADEDGVPSGYDEVCYLARWRFTQPSDTCATVTIDVPRRTLVPMPSTFVDVPIMETVQIPNPTGSLDPGFFGEEQLVTVTRQVEVDGVPQFSRIEIPPEPLPTPTVHAVSATPVLPVADANKIAGRAFRARVRDLRQQLRTLKQAGTTYSAMTAAQRLLVNEYVALTGEAAPLAV